MKKIITVEGMACEHCVNAVKTALEGLDGVKSAKVDLKKKTATVKLSNEISNEVLSKAVADAGFTATEITEK
ncbi:MAG: heavy-metal-associated domain-containing protein [Eubacterium sp.]